MSPTWRKAFEGGGNERKRTTSNMRAMDIMTHRDDDGAAQFAENFDAESLWYWYAQGDRGGVVILRGSDGRWESTRIARAMAHGITEDRFCIHP